MQIAYYRILIVIMMMCFQPAFAAQRITTIIPIYNADAESILPALQQQLLEDESISVYQQQIIINASANSTANIKQLINVLDAAGKQLIINIKNNATNNSNQQGINVNNQQHNPSTRIIKNGKLNTETHISIQQNNGNRFNQAQQGIRATEGEPSFIHTGSARIITSPSNNNGQAYQQQWHQAQTGFYATTWVNGDGVSIRISQQDQKWNNASIDTQSLNTSVTGKLGEWIPIANLHQHQNTHSRSITGKQGNTESSDTQLMIKVELAP